ncbi:acetoin reductase family protein [Agrocybe pediades]|nr:acetoin reductase family protein [Agrocybe pediades]
MLFQILKRSTLSASPRLCPTTTITRMMSRTAVPPGRVAIVTGASRGIGRAIAFRLASDGYDVSLNDLPSAQSNLEEVASAIDGAGRRAFVRTGDVSKEGDVKRLVEETVERLGSLDVMVANAGFCFMKPFNQISIEEWDKIFSVNVRGVFLSYKYASDQMIKQGRGGRIIGASSIAGKKGEGLLAAYSSTKFAVRGLTQAAAQELAQYGITVNTYSPGPIDTVMLKVITEASPASEEVNVGNAMGVAGSPEDVAGLVSYLASDESRFMTGQAVTIDGGRVYD